LRLAPLGDVVLERRLDPFSLLDLGVQHLGGLLKGRAALVERLLQVVVGPSQILLGAAAGGDVLNDRHKVTHGTLVVENGDDIAADPQARTVGLHAPGLDGESLADVGGTGEQVAQVRLVGGIGQIVNAHLQQPRRRMTDDLAESVVDEIEASAGVHLRDADAGLAEHGAKNLLLLAQLGFEPPAQRHIRAERDARRRNADHEHDQREE
jgi:hypothetical protein